MLAVGVGFVLWSSLLSLSQYFFSRFVFWTSSYTGFNSIIKSWNALAGCCIDDFELQHFLLSPSTGGFVVLQRDESQQNVPWNANQQENLFRIRLAACFHCLWRVHWVWGLYNHRIFYSLPPARASAFIYYPVPSFFVIIFWSLYFLLPIAVATNISDTATCAARRVEFVSLLRCKLCLFVR